MRVETKGQFHESWAHRAECCTQLVTSLWPQTNNMKQTLNKMPCVNKTKLLLLAPNKKDLVDPQNTYQVVYMVFFCGIDSTWDTPT